MNYKETLEAQEKKLNGFADQLNQLQTEITTEDALSAKHGKASLDLALKAGAILRQAQRLVPYGQWEKWLADNVKGITARTAQNYMRLAQRVAIETEAEERRKLRGEPETKHVSFLDEAQSLREAYLSAGIIKRAPKKGKAEGEMKPEKVKESNKDEYGRRWQAAFASVVKRTQSEVAHSGVNWDVRTWTIKNGKPASGDESNLLALTVKRCMADVSLRRFGDLTREDEIELKASALLSEILKSVMAATCPQVPETKSPEGASEYEFQFNGGAVEPAEQVAA